MPIKDLEPISPLDVFITEIDEQIENQTNRLISGGSAAHDHTTGILKGLQTAKQRAIELRKRWYEPEPTAVEVSPTHAIARPSRLRRV